MVLWKESFQDRMASSPMLIIYLNTALVYKDYLQICSSFLILFESLRFPMKNPHMSNITLMPWRVASKRQGWDIQDFLPVNILRLTMEFWIMYDNILFVLPWSSVLFSIVLEVLDCYNSVIVRFCVSSTSYIYCHGDILVVGLWFYSLSQHPYHHQHHAW